MEIIKELSYCGIVFPKPCSEKSDSYCIFKFAQKYKEEISKDMEEYCNSPHSSNKKSQVRFDAMGDGYEIALREIKMYKYISRGSPNDVKKLDHFLSTAPELYFQYYKIKKKFASCRKFRKYTK